ncbi:hypothetical protein KUH03_40050 [Sphingobacterium sp. E70]|nr:two-component regulator propeller domain-containing protein [Sphingobacterium sp. E70]ULT24996.1 hypothetical protein KUH03_40050 [Sphingobacterium sp. E70]
MGTNGKGLIKLNETTGERHFFRSKRDDMTSLSSDIVTALHEDYTNKMWIGTFMGGLNVYDGGRFKRYEVQEKNNKGLSNQSIYGITEDSDQNLWIATLGAELTDWTPVERYLKILIETIANYVLISFFPH